MIQGQLKADISEGMAVLCYKEIKRILTKEISKMEPMDKLPSRLFLCKKFDTTRTTLDKLRNWSLRELYFAGEEAEPMWLRPRAMTHRNQTTGVSSSRML